MLKSVRISLVPALLALIMAGLFAACGSQSGASAPTASPTSVPAVPLKITRVDISLSVPTIRNIDCGTTIIESYNAVFHFPTNNSGGTVTFQTTTNNGRSNQPASLTVRPQQTSATYTFIQSGQVNAENVFPGRGGVRVTAPNTYASDLVAPLGPCRSTPGNAAFRVTSIALIASPEITGHRCGTQFTEKYTATFSIVPKNPGGTIVFQYSTNNGRSSSANTSLPVAAGQTIATYTFEWSGTLQQDHIAPGIGIVKMSDPNQITSPAATPAGGCNTM